MTTSADKLTEPGSGQLHDGRRARFARLFGHDFVGGNAVRRLKNGDAIFEAMLETVRRARREINFTTFIYGKGDVAEAFADAFAERARAGVTVRVLVDAAGGVPMDPALAATMRAAGVLLKSFRPLRPWRLKRSLSRTHRKLLIVDNAVGFTGGVGIAWPWAGAARSPDEWRDSQFRFEGPVVVGLEAAFWSNWLEVEHLAISAIGDGPVPAEAGAVACLPLRSQAGEGWNDATSLLWGLAELAERRLAIATPYLAPTMRSLDALERAAARGVAVDVLIPGRHADKHVSNWVAAEAQERLVAAGVRLWEYQRTMLHLKQFVVDDDLACVGSINFNARSQHRDDEFSVVIHDRDLTKTLADDFADDLTWAEQVTLDLLKTRRPWRRPLAGAFRFLRHDV